MDSPTLLRQLLRVPSSYRTLLHSTPRPQPRAFALLVPSTAQQCRCISVPRIIQPSFWASLIPKPFRTSSSPHSTPNPATSKPKPKEWNPATPYIILSLLVGSQAIQILWLKRERDHYTRRADAKIGVLREVIERVQRGEEVEVEKVLGTGDTGAEREWKEVLKEIEEEEVLFRSKKRRRALRQAAAAEEGEDIKHKDRREEVVEEKEEHSVEEKGHDGVVKVETFKGAKFY